MTLVHSRKFIRDSVGFAVSQYVARAALTLRGVVAAALVGPTAYGAWNALMLLLEYGAQSQLGTQQGLDQVVPRRLVERDAPRLERTKRAGLFNIALFWLLSCPLLALVFRFTGGQILAFWGTVGVSAVLVCMLLGNVLGYHGTLLRSHGDIAAVSWALMLQSLAGALLGLALAPWLGVWGLLWGWLAGSLIALGYARVRGGDRVPLSPAPSSEGVELLRVGFPIFLFTSATFVLRSLDRVVILRGLGTTELGYYTLSIMAVTFLLYLSDSVSYVLYPRLVTRHRETGGDPAALRGLMVGPMRALSLLMPFVTGLVYLAADDLVNWLLPRFHPGVGALRTLGFGTVALALGSIPSFTLITLRRVPQLVTVTVLSTGAALGLDLAALAGGHGIKGVAAATLAAYLIQGAALQWLAFGRVLRAERAALMLKLHLPLLLAIAIAYAVEHAVPGLGTRGARGALRLAGTLVLFAALYLPAAAPFARGLGLRGILGEFRVPGLAPRANGGNGR